VFSCKYNTCAFGTPLQLPLLLLLQAIMQKLGSRAASGHCSTSSCTCPASHQLLPSAAASAHDGTHNCYVAVLLGVCMAVLVKNCCFVSPQLLCWITSACCLYVSQSVCFGFKGPSC
jgi:hypothetical protein